MLLLYPILPYCSHSLSKFTFHYASTLSNFVERLLIRIILIYIPLCFYFIYSDFEDDRMSDYIYIPLCFYFIKEHPECVSDEYSFTFHYASTLSKDPHDVIIPELIYIPLCFYFIKDTFWFLFLTNRIFTFHYASTLSQKLTRIRQNLSWFTFHYASTLSVWDHLAVPGADQIYIPLCFYFIG